METKELIIEPGRAEDQYWYDVWAYRELFYFLAWRDILARYKQTVVGIAWSLLRPLITMLVFTVVFNRIAKLPSDGVPYPIMVMAAMLPWGLFAGALGECGSSILRNSGVISKVYFPRLIVPVSAVIVCFVDFLIAAVLLAGLMVFYQYLPGWQVVTLPIFALMALVASVGIGLWLAALTVRFRDFTIVVPFIIQFGLYISPVGFSSSVIPEQWRLIYSFNPLVGVIDGFRWAISRGTTDVYLPGMLASAITIVLLFVTGIWYFRSVEKSFADLL